MSFVETPLDQIPQIVQNLRDTFNTGKTRDINFRKSQLKGLYKLLDENASDLKKAIYQDLKKPEFEAQGADILLSKNEAIHALNHLSSWVQESVDKKLANMSDDLHIHHDPLGLVLIIGAWNYPVQLVLQPLAGAIAAGNTVIIKPSEVSPHTSAKLTELFPKYLDSSCYTTINGGVEETTRVLEQRFDHIFYTGNSTVAKIVMKAASNFLTPVTLELGGKSPTVIDKKVDIKVTSRRVLWGKCMNAGQTCIAPDYVLCHKSQYQAFLQELKEAYKEWYGDDPAQSPDFGRIVNQRQFQRLKGMLDQATADANSTEPNPNGRILLGGQTDAENLYIAPTLLVDVSPDAAIMQNEIFGPILPILQIESAEEAINFINSREKPLALYLFSTDNHVVESFEKSTSSGAFVVNDTMLHNAAPTLPFGGVGYSGMGSYHGKRSFEAFSHKKAVMKRTFRLSQLDNLRFPPMSEKKSSWVEWLLGEKPSWGVF